MADHSSGNGVVQIYYDGRVEDYELRSIRYELASEGVALCTLNEPDNLNALSFNLVQECLIILEHAKRDDAVRVLVWTGAGRAFCSGASLKGSTKMHLPPGARAEYLAKGLTWEARTGRTFWATMTLAFWDFPKISIAAVNGLAVGGGANLALCNLHDFVLCSEAARFKYPFVALGATPEFGSSAIIPHIVGVARSKELLLLGEWFSASEALALGLANRVLPAEQLLPEALALARKVAAEPNPDAQRLGKQIINRQLRAVLEDVLDEEERVIKESVAKAKKTRLPAAPAPKAKL